MSHRRHVYNRRRVSHELQHTYALTHQYQGMDHWCGVWHVLQRSGGDAEIAERHRHPHRLHLLRHRTAPCTWSDNGEQCLADRRPGGGCRPHRPREITWPLFLITLAWRVACGEVAHPGDRSWGAEPINAACGDALGRGRAPRLIPGWDSCSSAVGEREYEDPPHAF